MNSIMFNKDDLLKEMVNKQLKNIPHDKKLNYTDMKRIIDGTKKSIFDGDECCLWSKSLTNKKNKSNSQCYINFWLKGDKKPLHRILHINYVDNLESNHYIKYICDNKGVCCNINHFKKVEKKIKNEKKIIAEKNVPSVVFTRECIKKKLTVNFS